MEGINVTMGGGTIGGAMGSLKGSLETQKNAVGQLLSGAQEATASIAKEGTDAARQVQMQQMGVGQKLDLIA